MGEDHVMTWQTPAGTRFSAPGSCAEQLEEADLPAPSSQSSAGPMQQSSRGRDARTATDISCQQRPWSRADTDLSKTLSQVLRHKSQLRLDSAGYASMHDPGEPSHQEAELLTPCRFPTIHLVK